METGHVFAEDKKVRRRHYMNEIHSSGCSGQKSREYYLVL